MKNRKTLLNITLLGLLVFLLYSYGKPAIIDELDRKAEVNVRAFVSAHKNLFNRKPSKMKIVLIRPADRKRCKGKKGCAQIISLLDRGTKKDKAKKVTYRVPGGKDWNKAPGQTVRFFLGSKPLVAQYSSQTNTMTLLKGNWKKVVRGIKKVKPLKNRFVNLKPIKGVQPHVIPPDLWDWLNGTEGQCCPDCWATHRALSLPCSADAFCCFGSCDGTDPNCQTAPPGGGGGGPGGDGSGDDCKGSYYTSGTQVDTGDYICTFIGEVTKVEDDMGFCVDVFSPSNGSFVNCQPKDGLGGGGDEPAEAQSWF